MNDCRRSNEAIPSGFRVPLSLLGNEQIKGLSDGAKLAICFMVGRTALSAERGWVDQFGRSYVEYPVQELKQDLGCGKDKAMKILTELEGKDANGLIRRFRRGQGKPDMIYFNRSFEELIKRNLEVGTSDRKNSSSQDIYNNYNYSRGNFDNNKFISNVDKHIKSYQSSDNRCDGFDAGACIALIKDNIEYNSLVSESKMTKEYIDEIMEIISEVVYNRNEYIRVGKAEYPKNMVVGRFEKLNFSHIQYVMDCFRDNTKKITNIRSYILTSLFNAPATINHYYQAEVNHDFYGS